MGFIFFFSFYFSYWGWKVFIKMFILFLNAVLPFPPSTSVPLKTCICSLPPKHFASSEQSTTHFCLLHFYCFFPFYSTHTFRLSLLIEFSSKTARLLSELGWPGAAVWPVTLPSLKVLELCCILPCSEQPLLWPCNTLKVAYNITWNLAWKANQVIII